jgi:aryl-alcohol dehydrogenase-like predicted oxidoreductase
MTRQRALALGADDWRSRDPEFQEPQLTENLELVERLRALGQRRGCSAGQAAIAWVLRHPAVTGAIVGARNPKQVEQNVAAFALRLTDEEIREIEGVTEMAGSINH